MTDLTHSPQRLPQSPQGATVVSGADGGAFELGLAPLKVVTGTQTTSSLSFVLEPGAIVAHSNARVIFVCG